MSAKVFLQVCSVGGVSYPMFAKHFIHFFTVSLLSHRPHFAIISGDITIISDFLMQVSVSLSKISVSASHFRQYVSVILPLSSLTVVGPECGVVGHLMHLFDFALSNVKPSAHGSMQTLLR